MLGAVGRVGVLFCMDCVDLNLARAGMCEALQDSEHTSVRYRLESGRSAIPKALLGASNQSQATRPVAGLDVGTVSDLTGYTDIELVCWMGLQAHSDKHGRLSADERAPPDVLRGVANHIPASGDQARPGDREPLVPREGLPSR